MYLNVEPIHIAEEIFNLSLPDIEQIRQFIQRHNPNSLAFGVMLDDTYAPGSPAGPEVIKDFLSRHNITPCVTLLETDLTSLALALLVHLPPNCLRFERRKIWYVCADAEFVLVRDLPKITPRRPAAFQTFVHDGLTKPAAFSGILPTCRLYTTAWYYFRLTTPSATWATLAAAPPADLYAYLIDLARQVDTAQLPKGMIATFLPKQFMDNERDAKILLRHFLEQPPGGQLEDGIFNEWI